MDDDEPVEDVRDDELTRSGDPGWDPGTAAGADAAPEPDAVDVPALRARLAAAEQARDEALRRTDALTEALADVRSRPVETFGMRADKIVRMAQHEADQRRRAVEQEAAEVHARAHAEAARITADAVADAERIRAEARADAERAAADAAREVEQVRSMGTVARRESERVADTAASMHAHVADLRRGVREEVARLHALLGAELGRLDRPARPPGGGAHQLREPGGRPVPAELPPVTLPEQRAAGPRPSPGPAAASPASPAGPAPEPETAALRHTVRPDPARASGGPVPG
ncbi:hypothetical protein [Pseudonocardia sp. HH130630-07]|uniref:hypothetical protein n=1 Tax=Pseudonocardia sp. HH130630-07 TaxID=1690815 RepID=UPI0012E9A0C9|nr:hypothetical protein [Pseudonocardia sp. HH130630-07]